jgi:hypothetical protein
VRQRALGLAGNALPSLASGGVSKANRDRPGRSALNLRYLRAADGWSRREAVVAVGDRGSRSLDDDRRGYPPSTVKAGAGWFRSRASPSRAHLE